jgi:hypothetical protein
MMFDRLQWISEQTVVAYFKGISDTPNGRGAQIEGFKSSGRQNFVRWRLIFVGLQYGISLLAPRILWWLLDFGKFVLS